jgi:hypothetical protein
MYPTSFLGTIVQAMGAPSSGFPMGGGIVFGLKRRFWP